LIRSIVRLGRSNSSAQEQSEPQESYGGPRRERAAFSDLLTTFVSFTIGMLMISDVSAYFQFNETIDPTDVIFSALIAAAFTIKYSNI
jgi:hypothetical protein